MLLKLKSSIENARIIAARAEKKCIFLRKNACIWENLIAVGDCSI